MNNLVVECVWYQSKRDFNRFIRAIEDPEVCIIDYMLIKNKLIKADSNNVEPSDSVIGVNIITMVRNALDSQNTSINTIVYSFKNLNIETVSNFKDLVSKYTDREWTLTLNVLNMNKIPSKHVLSKFDLVKFVKND